jgi:hypothetical protein
VPPTPLPATHLVVLAPKAVQGGQTFPLVVIAENALNLPVFDFTDTITLSSSDKTAKGSPAPPWSASAFVFPLPFNYTFTLGDHGFHIFQMNLSTPGPQTVTATDISPSPLASIPVAPGTANILVNPAPTLGMLGILMPKTAAVGAVTPVTIVAEDSSGHILPGFSGTVTLSTSDAAATGLPPTYTFVPLTDHGFHTFKVTFNTPDTTATGPTTVTATDGAITNTASILVQPASAVTHFAIFQAGLAIAGGKPTPIVVVALNASNQVVSGYTGTVTFSSSDSTATASDTAGGVQTPLSTFSYTFGGSDNGIHVFYVTFGTPGKQTFTVSDLTNGVSNTINVFVIGPLATSGHSWLLF